jgi:hypothetical protein
MAQLGTFRSIHAPDSNALAADLERVAVDQLARPTTSVWDLATELGHSMKSTRSEMNLAETITANTAFYPYPGNLSGPVRARARARGTQLIRLRAMLHSLGRSDRRHLK